MAMEKDGGGQGRIYVTMMVDALKKKVKILTALYEKTKEQEALLRAPDFDVSKFNESLEEKGGKIEELNELDEGFDTLFRVMKKEMGEERLRYRDEILEMQRLITEASEIGVQIQALEQQNSGHLKVYLAGQRKAIREYNQNRRMTASYNQNMSQTRQADQSYFINQTK